MLLHTTSKFKLLVPTRCGTTSFCKFFGYEKRPSTDAVGDWMQDDNRTDILVLRNPVERMHSASKMSDIGSHFWFLHCNLFLKKISKKETFFYIPFQNLNEYTNRIHVNESKTLAEINSSKTVVKNKWFTQEEFNEEREIYEYIRQTQKHLPIDVWKSLIEHK